MKAPVKIIGSACFFLFVSACASLPGGRFIADLAPGGGLGSGRITQEQLRDALVQYAGRFEATVVAAADTISDGTKDPLIQRRALRWKLGVTPVANQAAFLNEPEAAYVALLTLATSMRNFLATGGGATVFGEQQSIAVDASLELHAAAIDLGRRFLSENELARVTGDVETVVAAQPLRGEFVAERVQNLVMSTGSSATFAWVTEIPLSPFTALRGVDQGAQAMREINETAREMTRVVSSMPQLMRWNLELLAFELGQQGDIASGLEDFDSLARSAESLSQTVQVLPESLRELLAEAEGTGRSLGPLSQSLERTAAALATAGASWGGLVAELRKPPADPSQPARSFDILEWERTAAQVTSAAAELRTLLDSIQAFAGSDALGPPLAELTARVERVEAGSRSLVDLAALRGLQLILAFFVLLFFYRRLEGWLARRAADTLRSPQSRDRG